MRNQSLTNFSVPFWCKFFPSGIPAPADPALVPLLHSHMRAVAALDVGPFPIRLICASCNLDFLATVGSSIYHRGDSLLEINPVKLTVLRIVKRPQLHSQEGPLLILTHKHGDKLSFIGANLTICMRAMCEPPVT